MRSKMETCWGGKEKKTEGRIRRKIRRKDGLEA